MRRGCHSACPGDLELMLTWCHTLEVGMKPEFCMLAAAGRPRLFSDGPNMFNAITTVVGYLNAEGYCYNGKCHVRTLPLIPRISLACLPACSVCRGYIHRIAW